MEHLLHTMTSRYGDGSSQIALLSGEQMTLLESGRGDDVVLCEKRKMNLNVDLFTFPVILALAKHKRNVSGCDQANAGGDLANAKMNVVQICAVMLVFLFVSAQTYALYKVVGDDFGKVLQEVGKEVLIFQLGVIIIIFCSFAADVNHAVVMIDFPLTPHQWVPRTLLHLLAFTQLFSTSLIAFASATYIFSLVTASDIVIGAFTLVFFASLDEAIMEALCVLFNLKEGKLFDVYVLDWEVSMDHQTSKSFKCLRVLFLLYLLICMLNAQRVNPIQYSLHFEPNCSGEILVRNADACDRIARVQSLTLHKLDDHGFCVLVNASTLVFTSTEPIGAKLYVCEPLIVPLYVQRPSILSDGRSLCTNNYMDDIFDEDCRSAMEEVPCSSKPIIFPSYLGPTSTCTRFYYGGGFCTWCKNKKER